MHLAKLEEDYNPVDRIAALTRLAQARENDEVLTGLFYLNPDVPSFTDRLNLVGRPLGTLPQSVTRPAKSVLDGIMEEYR
jgi:2-oxoglutarate ferredoxin oxidoreductase subunit beta